MNTEMWMLIVVTGAAAVAMVADIVRDVMDRCPPQLETPLGCIGGFGASRPTQSRSSESVTSDEMWRVQLWLADHLIEEHVAPTALAEQYANVIRLRIRGLSGRRLRCEPISSPELRRAPTSYPFPR